jgi:hypothetical protein
MRTASWLLIVAGASVVGQTRRPVIVMLINGRPLAIPDVDVVAR